MPPSRHNRPRGRPRTRPNCDPSQVIDELERRERAGSLRLRASREANDLGPEPSGARDRKLWLMERAGAVIVLASLAEWDATLLRRAALEKASESTDQFARDLLLDAAQERA
jgi:hypothetical protein